MISELIEEKHILYELIIQCSSIDEIPDFIYLIFEKCPIITDGPTQITKGYLYILNNSLLTSFKICKDEETIFNQTLEIIKRDKNYEILILLLSYISTLLGI